MKLLLLCLGVFVSLNLLAAVVYDTNNSGAVFSSSKVENVKELNLAGDSSTTGKKTYPQVIYWDNGSGN